MMLDRITSYHFAIQIDKMTSLVSIKRRKVMNKLFSGKLRREQFLGSDVLLKRLRKPRINRPRVITNKHHVFQSALVFYRRRFNQHVERRFRRAVANTTLKSVSEIPLLALKQTGLNLLYS